jgi:uncharacterized membrane protein YcaP (DUF421 family)
MRVSVRRTLAEMSPFDFVVAVALGAIVGRTATTAHPSYVQGVTGVLTLVCAHRVVTWLRVRSGAVRAVLDRPPVLVVRGGRPLAAAMRRAGLTEHDIRSVVREHGLRDLDDVDELMLEPNGRFSVVPRSGPARPDGPVRPAGGGTGGG